MRRWQRKTNNVSSEVLTDSLDVLDVSSHSLDVEAKAVRYFKQDYGVTTTVGTAYGWVPTKSSTPGSILFRFWEDFALSLY
jgi:hypothetical protein